MRILILILLIFSSLIANAQIITESTARAELQKRGIDEQRFKEEMKKRGIDLDHVDPTNIAEVQRISKEAKEVYALLEAEKLQNEPLQIKDSTDLISQKKSEIQKSRAQLDTQKIEIKKSDISSSTKDNMIKPKKGDLADSLTYGQHLFRDQKLKIFDTTNDYKPTANYILGPGDVVAVSVFGYSHTNFALEINKEGYIQPTLLPRMYLKGLTLEQAEKLVMAQMRNRYLFKAEDFKMTVVTPRTINVNIFGEVVNNGSYNISAVNTAFNALAAAGGLNEKASVRKIKLLRGAKTMNVDIYEFINNPSISQQLYLMENDYIQVPVADKIVTIKGGINRPYKYELLENENLKSLIDFGGGLTAEAVKKNIQITRIENDGRKIIDVNLNDQKDYILKNGDVIVINEVKESIEDFVSISGAVEHDGKYAFTTGMKLSDLVKRNTLRSDAVKDIAFISRRNIDRNTVRYIPVNIAEALTNELGNSNILLQKGDELLVRSYSDFSEEKYVAIDGAVRIPGKQKMGPSSNLKVSDLIFLSGNITDEASSFAYLFRKKGSKEITHEYYFIDINDVLKNKNSTYNYILNADDSVYVFKSEQYFDKIYVKVDGAVRNPTNLLYNPTLSVKDALLLSGGLKQEASPNRIEIFRLEVGNEKKTSTLAAQIDISNDPQMTKAESFKLQPYDLIFVRNAPEFELQRTVSIDGEVVYPGRYALLKDNTKLSDIIIQSGGVTQEAYLEGATLYRFNEGTGYVIINLSEALKNNKSYHNIILQEGDVLNLPKKNNIVSITGATKYDELYPERMLVNGKVNIAYQGDKDALYYINNYAGGLQENADKNGIVVEHKNGKVEKVKNMFFFKKFPKVKEGSTIKVPYKREKVKNDSQKKDIDWGSVLKDSIAQATAIFSLILLVRSVD